ncbi:phage terminase small subunit [Sodalis sp. RH18]|uniref:phage terminase small subunit n=1 Tax=Sodalis sp. RH18 TaxID=3394333 RepID=UPI0039B3EC1F
MISPGMRHKAEIAARRQLDAGQALEASPDSLHIQLRELARDVSRLRALPMTRDRVEMKRRTLLPKWMPTVEQYLARGEVYTNLVFSHCVIWLFDIGEFDRALEWAEIAIEQGQPTPDNFKSRFPAFVADTVLEWAEREAEAGHSVEPYFSRVFAKVSDDWRLHEEISAKWFKFAGLLLLRDDSGKPLPSAIESIEQLQAADALLAEAHKFHAPVGVKTLREKIGMRIRGLQKRLPHGRAGAEEGDPSYEDDQPVDPDVPSLNNEAAQ